MTLGEKARQLVAEIARDHQGTREELIDVLSKGYDRFCQSTAYGRTSSGYKAWRREVRRHLGLQPQPYENREAAKLAKTDDRTQDMFGPGYRVGEPHPNS